SPHIQTLLGFSQQEWLEDPFLWYRQLHPDDRALWIAEFARGCRAGGPFRAECGFLARDDRIVWVRGEARLVKDERGRPLFLQGIAFDITESKRAEQILVARAVRSTEERYRDVVEGIGAIFWEADVNTLQFTFVSQQAERILGYPVERWLADPQFWIASVHPDDRGRVAAEWQTLADGGGGDHELEYRALTLTGDVVWLHNRVRVAHDEAGRPRCPAPRRRRPTTFRCRATPHSSSRPSAAKAPCASTTCARIRAMARARRATARHSAIFPCAATSRCR